MSASRTLDFNAIRQSNPALADWSDQRIMNAMANKKAALMKQNQADNDDMGWSGVGNDVRQSLYNIPSAALDIIKNLRGQLKATGSQIVNDPSRAIANVGAGIGEGIQGLINIPSNTADYLASKGIISPEVQAMIDKTHRDAMSGFEQSIGLGDQQEGDTLLRLFGQFMPANKLASYLPVTNPIAKTAVASTGWAAGQNQDPVQAAIMATLPQFLASKAAPLAPKAPAAIMNTAQAIPQAVKAIPEVATNTVGSGLEVAADAASHIPGAGLVLQPTVGAIASYLKHIAVPPEEAAKRALFGDIEQSDIPNMQKMNDAAKRLGLTYVTPSELLQSPFESVKQAGVGRTTPGMKLLYNQGQIREGSEEAAINKLMDLIHTDKLDPIKKAAYEQTMQQSLPDSFVQEQMQRPVVQQAMAVVDKNPAFKQMLQDEYGVSPDNLAKNSFMYWDMVKRALGNQEGIFQRAGSNTEASVYGKTRQSMVNKMDAIEPQYKIARNIAERGFTRQEIEDIFDKKDKNFNNFDSYLKSKENYNSLVQKLKPFPEALQQLQDIKLFSGKMIPNNPTVRAAAALKRTGMSDARNQLEAQKRALDERFGQAHDVAAVKLLTDPDLMSKLKDYLAKK